MPNVGSHQVAPFVGPADGLVRSAASVKDNDDALRAALNAHDADATVHLQSSLLAARPAAGAAGRVWVTTDTGARLLWVDDGAAWRAFGYLPLTGGTVAGDVTVQSNLVASGSPGEVKQLNGATFVRMFASDTQARGYVEAFKTGTGFVPVVLSETGGGVIIGVDPTGAEEVRVAGAAKYTKGVGVWGATAPTAKPTISGSRASALTSIVQQILAAGAAEGRWTDATTA